jgi:putative transposase
VNKGFFRKGVELRIDRVAYRLIRQVNGSGWIAEALETGNFVTFTETKLFALYRAGKLALAYSADADASVRKLLASGISADNPEWEMAKVRRAFVLEYEDALLSKDNVAKRLAALWEKLGRPLTNKGRRRGGPAPPTTRSIIKWRARLLDANGDPLGLVARKASRGNRDRRMPEAGIRLIKQAIDAVYLTTERQPLKAAMDEAQALVINENKCRPKRDQLRLPGIKVVRSVLYDYYDQIDIDVERYGREEAAKRFRAVLRHTDTVKPNVLWQIDHTLLDCIVIDDENDLPLGRPWICIAIDVDSRMIMGIHISFYPPCQLSLYGCLKQSILPKDWLKESYPDIESDWPAYGLPDAIKLDRALENFANGLIVAMGMVAVSVLHAPRKMPWMKPFVERFNGTMAEGLIHQMPGTTFSNILEKMGYNSVGNAVVRYSVLKKLIYKWIVDVYHNDYHRTLQTSPLQRWTVGIRPEEIRLPPSVQRLDVILGRRLTRTLSHKGVEFGHLLYNSTDLVDLRIALGEKLKVTVSVDDSNLGSIVVFHPETNEGIRVPALRQEYAEGITADQHRAIRQFAKLQYGKINIERLLMAKKAVRDQIRSALARPKLSTRKRAARLVGEKELEGRVALEGTLAVQDAKEVAAAKLPKRSALPSARTAVVHKEAGIVTPAVYRSPDAPTPVAADLPNPGTSSAPVVGYVPLVWKRKGTADNLG